MSQFFSGSSSTKTAHSLSRTIITSSRLYHICLSLYIPVTERPPVTISCLGSSSPSDAHGRHLFQTGKHPCYYYYCYFLFSPSFIARLGLCCQPPLAFSRAISLSFPLSFFQHMRHLHSFTTDGGADGYHQDEVFLVRVADLTSGRPSCPTTRRPEVPTTLVPDLEDGYRHCSG